MSNQYDSFGDSRSAGTSGTRGDALAGGRDPIDDAKRRILTRVPLDKLIGETVQLTTRSGKPIGRCPFHEENTPSFYVYGDHYYCYGCKASGDAIDFVRKTLGLEFIPALRHLAGKFGIEAPELEESASRVRRRNEDAALGKILAAAQAIFVANLASERGAKAREYIVSRGYTPEQMTEFGFGLTPDEPWGLVRALRLQGFREEDIKACSLASTSEKTGRAYDFFRERIMIPIRDASDRIIAYGGRTLNNDPAKYKNSAATRLFDKSATLFGFARAREAARKKRRMLVVEGYMDCMQLWAQGLGESVAVLGTALTTRHLQLIKTCAAEAILLFDGDTAGAKASLDAIDVALAHPELSLRVAVLPKGEDPDTFVRREGVAALEKILAAATGIVDFALTGKLRGKTGLQIPAAVSSDIVPWLASVPDRVQRSFLVARLAQLSSLPVATIEREIVEHSRRSSRGADSPHGSGNFGHQGVPNQIGSATSTGSAAGGSQVTAKVEPPRPRTPASPPGLLAYDVLGHIWHADPGELDDATLNEARVLVTGELDLDPVWAQFAAECLGTLRAGASPKTQPSDTTGFPEVQALISRLTANAAAFRLESGGGSNNRGAVFKRLVMTARQHKLRRTIAALKAQVVAAGKTPEDAAAFRDLLGAINGLSRELGQLEASLRGTQT